MEQPALQQSSGGPQSPAEGGDEGLHQGTKVTKARGAQELAPRGCGPHTRLGGRERHQEEPLHDCAAMGGRRLRTRESSTRTRVLQSGAVGRQQRNFPDAFRQSYGQRLGKTRKSRKFAETLVGANSLKLTSAPAPAAASASPLLPSPSPSPSKREGSGWPSRLPSGREGLRCRAEPSGWATVLAAGSCFPAGLRGHTPEEGARGTDKPGTRRDRGPPSVLARGWRGSRGEEAGRTGGLVKRRGRVPNVASQGKRSHCPHTKRACGPACL